MITENRINKTNYRFPVAEQKREIWAESTNCSHVNEVSSAKSQIKTSKLSFSFQKPESFSAKSFALRHVLF